MIRALLSYLLLQFALIPFLVSCNDDSNELPIEIELVTLNAASQPAFTFSQGDKIFFAFLITNRSDQDIVWYNYCDLFQSDIYAVYKLVNSKNQTYDYIGKPLSPPVDCNDRPVVLRVGDGYYFSVPWDKYADTTPLDSGFYLCKFALDISVNDFKKNSKSFNSGFQIK